MGEPINWFNAKAPQLNTNSYSSIPEIKNFNTALNWDSIDPVSLTNQNKAGAFSNSFQENTFDTSGLINKAPMGFYNGDKSFLRNALPSEGFTGWGMPTLNVAQGAFNAFANWENMKTQQDTLDFQKDMFSKQFDTQKKMVNSDLRDRQKVRVAMDPNAMSVDEYMKQNGI